MALPAKPTLLQVKDEFATATWNALPSPKGLREMVLQVFSGAASGKSLLTFANTGLPTYTSLTISSIQDDRATFNAVIGNSGSTTNRGVRFRYSVNSNMSSSSTTSWITDGTTNPSVLVTGLTEGTTYYVKVEFYNGFNQSASMERPITPVSFTTIMPCPPPENVSNIFTVGDPVTGHGFNWNHPSGHSSGVYRVHRSINGGSYTDQGTTTNTTFNQGRFSSSAYTVQYRVRRECSESNTSGWVPTNTANIPSDGT